VIFRFHFAIKNPFKRSRITQTDYIEYDRKITKNKSVEVQFSRWEAYNIFEFSVNTIWFGEDHGGIGFDIEVLGYMFAAKIYDIRHWDYENHCWEEYEEEEK
jgi:hypothetical protein